MRSAGKIAPIIKKTKNKKKQGPVESHRRGRAAEKQVLYLPKRDSAERFPELDLELNNVRLIDARMFSMALVNSGSNQWREFFRITMPREKVARREHNLGTGLNCEYSIAKPKGMKEWMMYRSYIRADELTMLDYKERKLFYLQYMPKALLTEGEGLSLQYIMDWLSIAYIMRNELERRRRGVATFGGGRRVSVTDLMVTPLYATHRKAYARELKKNFKTWPLMVAEAAEDIEKSLKHRLLFVENVLRFGQMQEVVKEFRKQNQEWVNERLKVTDIHKQIILGKKVIESLNKQRPFQSAYHLASELHELPASVGHSVFFCIAQKDLTLSIGKEEIVRKVTEKGDVPLRIQPTRYEYKPSAVTAYKASEFSEPLAISVHEAPRRAPSVNSLSGFSSESGASTATESPGEWQHNWKMQTMHRDMEHRLMDNSIQNPLQEKQLSELEAAQRIADEVDRRIALLNNPQQIGTLCSGKFDEFSQYYRDVFSENPIKLRRNKTTVVRLKNEIKRILAFAKSFDVSKAEDFVPIQAADYAHNEMIRMIPTNGGDPYDGLSINNAWKTLIDNGVLTDASKEKLKTIFSSNHSWVNVSCLSQKYIVPRCDQLPHESTTTAEYSSCSSSWILICALICVACAILLGFLKTS